MPRNGSGTYSVSVNFTTEAGSPPIEISKLDSALADIGTALTASIASDGQTNPSANLPMNGKKHTNVAAATALTDYVRLQELIDQDHVFYVDSGSADAYVITPSPAISAYEEGQRFVVRIANTNTGASTLNVNSEGATAIQNPDGTALSAGELVAGGYYEFVYDANSTPDRFVLTSMPSEIPDGSLSSNVPLKNSDNVFTGSAIGLPTGGSQTTPSVQFNGDTDTGLYNPSANTISMTAGGDRKVSIDTTTFLIEGVTTHTLNGSSLLTPAEIAAATAIDVSGLAATDGIYVDDAGVAKRASIQSLGLRFVSADADQTFALGDGNSAQAVGATARTYTIPANSSVAFPVGSVIGLVSTGAGAITLDPASGVTINSRIAQASTVNRTVVAGGMALLYKVGTDVWNLTGDIS